MIHVINGSKIAARTDGTVRSKDRTVRRTDLYSEENRLDSEEN